MSFISKTLGTGGSRSTLISSGQVRAFPDDTPQKRGVFRQLSQINS